MASDLGINCGTFISDTQLDCGPYKVRELINADVGTFYYYDAVSGALVAVVSLSNPLVYQCLGGPSLFVRPTVCTPNQLPYTCPDAGAD